MLARLARMGVEEMNRLGQEVQTMIIERWSDRLEDLYETAGQ